MKDYVSISEAADFLGINKETLRRWDNSGRIRAFREPSTNYRIYKKEQFKIFDEFAHLFTDDDQPAPDGGKENFSIVELFAGAGGMALGMEQAGLKCLALNEIDKWAVKTLRLNRPFWNVLPGDINDFSFSELSGKVDVITGGFPCQAFSYAGKKLGFKDARGTLFYEFARVVDETKPKICIGENVRGLLNHDSGKTLEGMKSVLNEIGYRVLEPKVLKAIYHQVPQKRERLILVGIRKDIELDFSYPRPSQQVLNLRDALKAGVLYSTDVPNSPGNTYPSKKKEILELVPPGGYWRDLPLEVQKLYMQKSYYLGGGKTGIARRMSWDEPCLTLTCNPAQKQTERCHPDETRPFTVREYARIQTFPDDWQFAGPVSSQYKQIGNAVPVNLAKAIGEQVVSFLNKVEKLKEKKLSKSL